MKGNTSSAGSREAAGMGSDSFSASQPTSVWSWFAPEQCCSAVPCQRGWRDLLCDAGCMSPQLPSLPGYPTAMPYTGFVAVTGRVLLNAHSAAVICAYLKGSEYSSKQGTFMPEGRIGV